jgi:hypothetical protein
MLKRKLKSYRERRNSKGQARAQEVHWTDSQTQYDTSWRAWHSDPFWIDRDFELQICELPICHNVVLFGSVATAPLYLSASPGLNRLLRPSKAPLSNWSERFQIGIVYPQLLVPTFLDLTRLIHPATQFLSLARRTSDIGERGKPHGSQWCLVKGQRSHCVPRRVWSQGCDSAEASPSVAREGGSASGPYLRNILWPFYFES